MIRDEKIDTKVSLVSVLIQISKYFPESSKLPKNKSLLQKKNIKKCSYKISINLQYKHRKLGRNQFKYLVRCILQINTFYFIDFFYDAIDIVYLRVVPPCQHQWTRGNGSARFHSSKKSLLQLKGCLEALQKKTLWEVKDRRIRDTANHE